MIGYQRSFTAGYFANETVGGMNYKVMAVFGYSTGCAIGKVAGYFVTPKLQNRAHFWIVVFVAISQLFLTLYGVISPPANFSMLLLNGIPHGFIWSLLVSTCASKRFPEVLDLGFQCSLILSSGILKSIARAILNSGGSDYWIPSVISGVLTIFFLCSIVVFESLPPFTPSSTDQISELPPMSNNQRKVFMKTLLPGLICWILTLSIATSYRNFRDSFAVDFWNEWGEGQKVYFLFVTEIISAFVVAVASILVNILIKSVQKRFIVYHIMGFVGFIFVILGGFLHKNGTLTGLIFMILSGIGCFLVYVPFRSLLHQYTVLVFQFASEASFIINIYSIIGYVVTAIVTILKGAAAKSKTVSEYFDDVSSYIGIIGLVALIAALVFLLVKQKKYVPIDEGLAKQLNEDEEDKKLELENEADMGPIYDHPNNSSSVDLKTPLN